ncbi:hypothetical protein BKA82DRAFT_1002976, partial [Pisolithus tinctorius]
MDRVSPEMDPQARTGWRARVSCLVLLTGADWRPDTISYHSVQTEDLGSAWVAPPEGKYEQV